MQPTAKTHSIVSCHQFPRSPPDSQPSGSPHHYDLGGVTSRNCGGGSPGGSLEFELKYADAALLCGWIPQLTDPTQTAAALSRHPHFAYSYAPGSVVRGFDGGTNFLHAAGPSGVIFGGVSATNYAIFGGRSSEYTATVSGNQIVVTGGPEALSRLSNVQYLHFADGVTVPAPTR